MRFLPFLLMALAATTVPTSMAAPSHLHRMVTNAYTTKPPTTSTPTIYYAPTEEPTEPPTEEPTYPPTEAPTEAPTYPPTEAPTYPPTTYAPTYAPTTYAPTTYAPTTYAPTTYAPTTYAPTYAPTTEAPTYAPTTEAPTTAAPYTTKAPTTSTPTYYPTDAPTEPPTRPAPTQLTWCHHEIIASTQEYTDVEFDLAEWMNTFLSFFGLDGTHTDYLTISLIPGAIDAPAIGNCTSPYVTTVDAYIRITLPSDIYPDFATRYDQYQLDHPWSVIPSTTCGAVVELNATCTNAPSATAIVPTTTAPTATSAPTTKTTSAPTTKTTSAPTTNTTVPTTKAPTARAPTQQPTTRTPTQKVNTTKVPTSAPTSSTITITTNVTQPDPNTRCIAGVCVSINNSATSTHITIVPVMASILALIMVAF